MSYAGGVIRVIALTLVTAGVGCSSPANAPAPTTAPIVATTDDAGVLAVPIDPIDAAFDAAPLIACGPDTRVVPAPWPARGAECASADGTRDGPFLRFHPDGTIATRGARAGGRLDGAYEERDRAGRIRRAGAYRAGVLDGTWRQLTADGRELGGFTITAGTGVERHWHDDGTLAAEIDWKDGVRDGRAQAWDSRGNRVLDEHWRADVRDGPRQAGLRSQLQIDETWKDGVVTGARNVWRKGRIIVEEHLDARGRLDGVWRSFRNSGKKREDGAYRGGRRDGAWAWYDAGGIKERGGSYIDGKRDGEWGRWTGRVMTWRASYQAGVVDGELVQWDWRGRELGRDTFVAGDGVERTFHLGGAVASETTLVGGKPHGAHVERFLRGRVATRGAFAKGKRHGTWQMFWPGGGLKVDARYDHGKVDGAYRRLRDSGDVALEATYVAGRREGGYVEFHTAGVRALAGTYKDDVRDGAWQSWDAGGVLRLEATYRAGLLDGPWVERHPDGSVAVSGAHKDGHRVGVWRVYALDGTLTESVDHGDAVPRSVTGQATTPGGTRR